MTAILSDLKGRGFVLHPLSNPKDAGKSPGKRPLLNKWQELKNTPEDIDNYIEKGCNIGLVCGEVSNVIVIDFDHELFVPEIFNEFEVETLRCGRTKGRGHIYFQYDKNIKAQKHHLLGLEILSNGSNAVLPPSIHKSGEVYKWLKDDAPIIPIPQKVKDNLNRLFKTETELKQVINKCRTCFRNILKDYPDNIPEVHGSSGREMMLAVCTDLKANGADEQHIKMFAKLMYREKFDEGRTIQEWRNIDTAKTWTCETLKAKLPSYVDFAECEKCEQRRAGFQNRPDLVPAPTIIDNADFTDVGNAKRLVATYGDRIRYCHPWKAWLCWNGKFWERDNTGQIFRYAKDTAKAMLTEAESMSGEMREKMRKQGIATKNLPKIKAMVTLAESEVGVSILPDELDKNIWLINLQNGILNLKTGQLQEHQREDFMTKISPVAFDASATCERWLAFLNRIFEGKAGVIEYVQKITGQCLTGDASEEQLFIFWGKGANGKSTLIETLAYILGDYSKTIGIESLIKKERSSISNDIARLKGARFVAANEPEFGDHISEGKVKNLTGKDTIQARFLFQENFEFKPEYKLIISTNHKPLIKGMDHGIWRRIKLVPFNVTIPEAERDKGLDIKLQHEAAGILNWVLRGCMAWQQNGLFVPQEVIKATEEYQHEMDTLADFISDCCEVGNPDFFVSHKEIYIIYCGWCKSNIVRTMSKKLFSTKMEEKGFARTKNEQDIRGFEGVKSTDYLKSVYEQIVSGELPFDYFDRFEYENVSVSISTLTRIENNNLSNLSKTENINKPSHRQIDNNTISVSVESVESVESIKYHLKEQYDQLNKPDSIIDLERMKINMRNNIILELNEKLPENQEIPGNDFIDRIINEYCAVRGWQ